MSRRKHRKVHNILIANQKWEKKQKKGKTTTCKIKFITLPGMIILLKDSRKVTAKIASLILNI